MHGWKVKHEKRKEDGFAKKVYILKHRLKYESCLKATGMANCKLQRCIINNKYKSKCGKKNKVMVYPVMTFY